MAIYEEVEQIREDTAVSPVCHFHASVGYAAAGTIWRGAGAAAVYALAYLCSHHDSQRHAATPLRNVSLYIMPHELFDLFGPSRSGNSTLLRLFNRLSDLLPVGEMHGRIFLDGQDIFARSTDVFDLRRRIGMVFAMLTPLPGSIYENLTMA